MKITGIFKNKKTKNEKAIIKVDKKQLEKIVGGVDLLIEPQQLTPKISKESHG